VNYVEMSFLMALGDVPNVAHQFLKSIEKKSSSK